MNAIFLSQDYAMNMLIVLTMLGATHARVNPVILVMDKLVQVLLTNLLLFSWEMHLICKPHQNLTKTEFQMNRGQGKPFSQISNIEKLKKLGHKQGFATSTQ